MSRRGTACSVALGAIVLALLPATSTSAPETLVLPLRTIGVSDTTAAVVGDLLQGELEGRGVAIFPASRLAVDQPRGEAACDAADCAAAAASAYGVSQVVYGSLSRLGDKIIVRVRALRAGEGTPYYSDQLTSATEEDLDTVARRVAEGIAAGRPNADLATVDTVTEQETLEPRRRASRSGIGLRAGFIFPASDSYGGVDRLTSARLSFKYETRNYFIETTPVLGFAWRGDTIEWTAFDLFGARIFGVGDWATYAGAGIGVHALNVSQSVPVDWGYGPYYESVEQSETTLALDFGVGLLALRTYDLTIVVDVRYHIVFADFDQVGGNGAHGLTVMFGTSR